MEAQLPLFNDILIGDEIEINHNTARVLSCQSYEGKTHLVEVRYWDDTKGCILFGERDKVITQDVSDFQHDIEIGMRVGLEGVNCEIFAIYNDRVFMVKLD